MRRRKIEEEKEVQTRNTEDVIDADFLMRYEDHSGYIEDSNFTRIGVPRIGLGRGCSIIRKTRIYA